MTRAHRVDVKDLRWQCDPDRLGFETTDEVARCVDIIGQERAVDAMRLGLEITSPGYNIYVSGLTGTGKSTTIKRLLERIESQKKDLLDLCYVHNFRSPDMPVCLQLPAGQGAAFKRAMAEVVKALNEHIPKAFESEAYVKKQKELTETIKNQRSKLATELESLIANKGFRLLEIQYGPFTRPIIVPVVNDKPVELAKLESEVDAGKMDRAELKRIRADHEMLTTKMEEVLKTTRDLDRELARRTSELDVEFASPIIDAFLKDVREKFSAESIREYLSGLKEFAIDNLETFTEPRPKDGDDGRRKDPAFEVNVIVDNSRTQDRPVIIETTPSYNNLFGTIERASDGRGDSRSDVTMIRAGSMLRANGGFLVLSLTDVLVETGVWTALKRALKNRMISIQVFDSLMMMPVSGLKPQPIEIEVKVVLIGDAESYRVFYEYDEDFQEIFKVKADFDSVMANNPQNVRRYAEFVRHMVDAERLLPFHKTAVAEVAEEGTRIAGSKDKISTRFSDVADVVREASYWAKKADSKIVHGDHVEKAVAERVHRVNLIEDKITEMVANGTILLDIDGERIGQINGLSIYEMGDYAFGKPVRITVESSVGRAGIINVERESDMSGRTYNKGSLIIEGYLRRKFAQDKPLTMDASICFEQSYSGVDGDSASSTEIYALLSSLSDLPLRQDLAVTGSVNQKGEIQPIGGVNEKINGFFDICRIKGLTGKQGVIIPKLNVVNLMLRKDVVEAIEGGKFHVYAVSSIDEGIELLTGAKSGRQLKDGAYERESVFAKANEKLAAFAERIKEFHDGGEE